MRAGVASALPVSLPWIERLVALDTTSRISNLGLIEVVRDDLAQAGLRPWLTYDRDRSKANLFATIPGGDGGTTGGVVLSGHTDVVPVEGQQWSSNPFVPVVRDGRLYGRGSADMKGFIGSVLTAVPDMLAARLRAPIHIALSFDEELGCLGAPLMLAEMISRGLKPAGCIVGEPTSMELVVAHKGVNAYRCRVLGRAAHSSLPELGANAIEYAALLVDRIRQLAEEMRSKGPTDAAFDTRYTTAQTGVIRGGQVINIVPAECEFEFECRNLPGVDAAAFVQEVRRFAADELLPKMRTTAPDAAIEFERMAVAPAMQALETDRITRMVRELTGDRGERKVSYGTEAGMFQAAGVPAVVFGPGDIRQAHRADEYIELAQIQRCDQFLRTLIATMTSADALA